MVSDSELKRRSIVRYMEVLANEWRRMHENSVASRSALLLFICLFSFEMTGSRSDTRLMQSYVRYFLKRQG